MLVTDAALPTARSAAAGSNGKRSPRPASCWRGGAGRGLARAAARAGRRPVLRRPCHAPRCARAGASRAAPSSRPPKPPPRRALPAGAAVRRRPCRPRARAALAPLPLRLRWIDGRAARVPGRAARRASRSLRHRPAAGRDRARARRQRLLRADPQPQPRLHAVQRRPGARRLRLSRPDRLGDQARQVRARLRASSASRRRGSPRMVCPIGGDALRDKRPAVIAALAAAELIALALAEHGSTPSRRPAAHRKGRMSMTDASAVAAAPGAAGDHQALPGRGRQLGRQLQRRAGRDPRAAGRERRRQEHAGQDHLRRAARRRGRDALGWQAGPGRRPARRPGRSASAWCSSISRCSRR